LLPILARISADPITGGHFRLLHRLCTEIRRILQINDLQTVTKQVVETARETLVIGPGI